jgi:hypothetical protein
MSKTVTFESKVWPGEVTFASPLSLEREATWEYAISDARRAAANGGYSAQIVALLPGFLACIETWNLKGFPERITPQNFPTQPKKERVKLVEWLVKNIDEIYAADIDIPNE